MCLLSRLDLTMSFTAYSFNYNDFALESECKFKCSRLWKRLQQQHLMNLWISSQVSGICQKFSCLLTISLNTQGCVQIPGLFCSRYGSTGHPETSALSQFPTLHPADHSILWYVHIGPEERGLFLGYLLLRLVQAVHVLRGDNLELLHLSDILPPLSKANSSMCCACKALGNISWPPWESHNSDLVFPQEKTLNNFWQSKTSHSWLETYSSAPASALLKSKLRKVFRGHAT